MSFWDWFKTDNSIKTTQEHFEYFDDIRKENLQEIENAKMRFLLNSQIPEEFEKYISWVNEDCFYLCIPYLKNTIVVRSIG
jgi:hypothetical protein